MTPVAKRYWSILASIAIILLTMLFVSNRSRIFQILWSAFLNKYDGESFIYWPIARLSTEWLAIPVGTLLLILTWILIRLFKRSMEIGYSTLYSILVMLILSIVAVIITVFSGMGDPAFMQNELATARIQNTNYHLIGMYPMGGSNQYMLIKCQPLNMGCQIVYKYAAPIVGINNIKPQLVSSLNGDGIALTVGDETVYTSE